MWRLQEMAGGCVYKDETRRCCTATHNTPEEAWTQAQEIDKGLEDWNGLYGAVVRQRLAEYRAWVQQKLAEREAENATT
jgi:hypothetical protein